MKYSIIEFNKKDMGNNDKIRGMVKIHTNSLLENAEGNRAFNVRSLKHLRESIALWGMISCPIVVQLKKKFIVIDGWHRVYAAKDTDSTITAILLVGPLPDISVRDWINDMMKVSNKMPNNWKPADYLENGVSFYKNKDYITAREICEDYGLAVNAVYNIFAYDRSVNVNKNLFEEGTWSISTKSLGNKTIRYAEELNKYMPFSMSSNFLHGFVKCVNKKGYNQKQMIEQCRKFPNHIHDHHNPSDFVRMLNKMHNHCILEEEQVYLG